MHLCAEVGNEQLFSYFLSLKGDFLARNYADETPFHLAAREGKLNILQLYFDTFKFDIDHESMVRMMYDMLVMILQDGWSAVHYAALNGFLSGIEAIHRKGATLTILDKLRRTPLHWACKYN